MKNNSEDVTNVKGSFLKRRPWLLVLIAAIAIVAISVAVAAAFGTASNKKSVESAEQDIKPASVKTVEKTSKDTHPETLSYTRVDPDAVKNAWAVVGLSKADGSGFTEVKDQYIESYKH